MLQFPDFNPIAFHIGPIKVHWYGIMYLIGFCAAWGLALYRSKKPWHHWNHEQVADLIFYGALGVILGGRIGYILFYNFPVFMAHPLTIFKIWDGGMSFHGGMLGVGLALWIYAKRQKRRYFEVMDFIAPFVPIGLAAGRIGNFINGELWGRVTTMPWGMVYPNAGPLPRHPSELYEFLLEGVLLFFILWFYSAKPRPCMAVTGLFLVGYGCFRTFCEFFRQPDPQLGFLFWGWVTMGMLLSVPMIIAGVLMMWWAYKKNELKEGHS